MPKQTWKMRSMMAEASVAIAEAPSLRAAARRLNVHVSTLSRAVRDGKLPPSPGARPRRVDEIRSQQPPAVPEPASSTTFEQWAHSTFDLSRAEAELVTHGQSCLTIAGDLANAPSVRLQAMAQFRATLRDLHLPQEPAPNGDTETNIRRFPRGA